MKKQKREFNQNCHEYILKTIGINLIIFFLFFFVILSLYKKKEREKKKLLFKIKMSLNETYFVNPNEYSLFERILVTIILSFICFIGVIGKISFC
jgi:hypothetical protein